MTITDSADLDVALEVVNAALDVIENHRDKPLQYFEKGGADFATDVDRAVEQTMREVIQAVCPGDAIQGEELDDSGPVDAERVWLIDPLCGTLNYAAGSFLFAVNVALTQGDDVLAAIVAEPATGMFYITDGNKAWQLYGSADESEHMSLTQLQPSAASRLVEVHLETADPDEQGFSSTRYLRSSTFQTMSPRYMGTGLPLAWVAAGQRAGFVISGKRGKSVHFTAGIGLCRAAGCTLSDLHGEPLHLANEGIVAAADATTHQLLLAGIAEQL